MRATILRRMGSNAIGAIAPLGLALCFLVASLGVLGTKPDPVAQSLEVHPAQLAFALWNIEGEASSLVMLTQGESATVVAAPTEGVYERVA